MSIYVCGDLHGSLGNVRSVVAQIKNPTVDDVIIVCGDFGAEYGPAIMGSFKKECKKFPGSWLVVRGNHDTRYWRDHTEIIKGDIFPVGKWNFSDKFVSPTLYQEKYPNIHYASDTGEVYNVDGYNFLTVPGAYSVDKFYRLANNMPYEYEEQLSYKEWEELINFAMFNVDNIDFVIGHTFPQYLEDKIKDLYLGIVDQNRVDKNSEEWLNVLAGYIEHGHNFKHYFGGHFHDDRKLNNKYTMLYRTVAKVDDYIGN